jgi:hypothetical protein
VVSNQLTVGREASPTRRTRSPRCARVSSRTKADAAKPPSPLDERTPPHPSSLRFVDSLSRLNGNEALVQVPCAASAGPPGSVFSEPLHNRREPKTCVTRSPLAAVLNSSNQSPGVPQPGPGATSSPSGICDAEWGRLHNPRHTARRPNQRRQPCDHPCRRQLRRFGRNNHWPDGRPQPRHQDLPQRTLVSNIVIDTSSVAVATDNAGVTPTSTRTVIIEPVTVPPAPFPSACSTEATSTAQ